MLGIQKNLRVAVYARVSSEDQQERGTIENQLEFARKYCDLHQLQVVEWYKDDGVSGTLPLENRNVGLRLLNDAMANKFELVLIYKLDRLGRSARVILNSVHELEQSNVKVRSMTEPFDTSDPSGRFLLTMLAGVADLERETIIERMWHGANRAAGRGKWVGGITPYGYKVNEEGYLEVNEDPLVGDLSEAEVIRLIYKKVAEEKWTTIKVADYLNSLGVPPAYKRDNRKVLRGKRKVNTAGVWHPTRIRNIIINTTYKGLHRYGKRATRQREIIEREVPAIVSEEIWDKAQQVLKSNQIVAMRNTKRQYLLRSLIKCGICDRTYYGTVHPGSNREYKGYYVCSGKNKHYDKKCSLAKNIPMDEIDDFVWKQCVEFIENPGKAIEELSKSLDHSKNRLNELKEELALLQENLHAKEDEIQNILNLFRKKIISSQEVEKQILEIKDEKEKIQNQIEETKLQIQKDQNINKGYYSASQLLSELKEKLNSKLTYEVKREIVTTLVDRIVVDTKINEHGRKEATVSVKFIFSPTVIHTDKRAINNWGMEIQRKMKLNVPEASSTIPPSLLQRLGSGTHD
ncbi:recombinase family protein [Thermoactinomyces sp. CICC 23799]|uniref:recombinase family protein n=2 Tax=Thermoactinomycetaceae TaxID=186824 RepID=UPI001E2A4970|nr:recombinase family protein [Thermoactinomyces sp. CICC 23799]